MKINYKSVSTIIAFLLLSHTAIFAQNTSKIAGQYKFGEGSILIINPNNTFMLVAYATLIKGAVVIEGDNVSLKPYKPEMPFVLYGRFNQKQLAGSKTMFKNFSDAQALISYKKDTVVPLKMKRVFNMGANCIAYPNVWHTPNKTEKLQLIIESQKTLFEFENNQGYNDFILMYFDTKTPDMASEFTVINEGKSLKDKEYGEVYDKYNSEKISLEEIAEMSKMYDKAFTATINYYCNPVYNDFEEGGIDLIQYKKTILKNEYYFVRENSKIGDANDYHNKYMIYEYKKITPKVLSNQTYTIDETNTIFQYHCK